MRWPWVWRSRLELAEQVIETGKELLASRDRQLRDCSESYDEMERNLTIERDKLRELLIQSQNYVAQHYAQNLKLTELIVTLKREGFAQPVNPADITTDAPLPGPIEEAIDQRAAAGTELHRALEKYARAALRREGATDDAVAQEIIKGASEEVFELL